MLDDGCVLVKSGICNKYEIECMGSWYAKKKCPVWAEAIEIQKYYNAKLNRELNNCKPNLFLKNY